MEYGMSASGLARSLAQPASGMVTKIKNSRTSVICLD
jgi:hypothetical protein